MKTKPGVCSKYRIRLAGEEQQNAWDNMDRHFINFLLGPAGTGKSFLSVAYAVQQVQEGKAERVIISRPVVEAGEKLGFLPGTLTDKLDPYMQPVYDALLKVTGFGNKEKLPVEVVPLAYMRGRTIDNAMCILDEAQNASYQQIKMFLTRMGKGSKMFLTADPTQSDINGSTAIGNVIVRLKGISGISVSTLTTVSVMRHPLVAEIIRAL